jgi:hypothetical protein
MALLKQINYENITANFASATARKISKIMQEDCNFSYFIIKWAYLKFISYFNPKSVQIPFMYKSVASQFRRSFSPLQLFEVLTAVTMARLLVCVA